MTLKSRLRSHSSCELMRYLYVAEIYRSVAIVLPLIIWIYRYLRSLTYSELRKSDVGQGDAIRSFKIIQGHRIWWHREIFNDMKHRATSLRQLSFLFKIRQHGAHRTQTVNERAERTEHRNTVKAKTPKRHTLWNYETIINSFRQTLLRYVRLMAWAVRLSSVCRLSVVWHL